MTASSLSLRLLSGAVLSLAALQAVPALAQGAAANAATPAAAKAPAGTQAPDEFIKTITADVLSTVKSDKALQSGDIRKVVQVVDTKIMPYVNFQRMTASAVGRGWRQASSPVCLL